MLQQYRTPQRSRIEVSGTDIAVTCIALCAVFYDSWRWLMDMLPHIAQGIIVTATVIFVLFRAVNEIRKYVRGSRDDS